MAHKGAVKNVPLEAMCFRVNPAMTTGNDDGQAFVSMRAGGHPRAHMVNSAALPLSGKGC